MPRSESVTAADAIDLAAEEVDALLSAEERARSGEMLRALLHRLATEAEAGTLANTDAQSCLRVIALGDIGDDLRFETLAIAERWARADFGFRPRFEPSRVSLIADALCGWWDGTDWGGGRDLASRHQGLAHRIGREAALVARIVATFSAEALDGRTEHAAWYREHQQNVDVRLFELRQRMGGRELAEVA